MNFTINKPVFDCDTLRVGMPIRIKCNNTGGCMYSGSIYDCLITEVTPLNIEVIYVEEYEGEKYTQNISIKDIDLKKIEILGELDIIKESNVGGVKGETKSKKNYSKKEMFD